MAGVIGNILIGLGVTSGGFDKGLGSASGKVRGFVGEVKGIGGSLAGAVGGALAGAGIAGLFVKAASAASDLNEQVSATGVVFKDSSGIVIAAADEMADKFGIVKSEFLEAANSLSSLFTAAGKSDDEAARLSVDMVKLATDLSSIRNIPVPEALAAIRSGLVGEAEPLRRYGVLLSEGAIQQEALRSGLAKSSKDLDDNAKFQARLNLITKGLAYANGDLARTFDGVANQGRAAQGRWTNAMAEFGKSFEPVTNGLLNLANTVVEGLTKALDENKDSLAAWSESAGASLKGAAQDAQPVVDAFNGIKFVVLAVAKGIKEAAAQLAYLIAGAAGIAGWLLTPLAGDFQSPLAEGLKAFRNQAVEDLDALGKTADDAGTKAATSMGKAAEATAKVATKAEQATAANAKLSEKVGDVSKKLAEEAATLGLTGRQADLVKLKMAGATDEQLRQAAGLAKMLDQADKVHKKQEDLASGAKSLVESTQTPMEKLRAETDRINQMLGAGLIDKTTAARGILQARNDSGLGKAQFAGAVEAGSQEARSALLAANGQSHQDDGLKQLAERSRDTAAATARVDTTLTRMEAMLRQFLSTMNGPMTAKIGT